MELNKMVDKKQWEIEWTDKEISTLKQLLAEGLSFGDIAMRLHRTKNSISGKIQRLGLSQPMTNKLQKKPHPTQSKNREQKLIDQAEEEQRLDVKPAIIRPPPVQYTPPPIRPPEHCQWPSGEEKIRFLCKAQIEGSGPYCTTHKKRAYTRSV